MTSPAELSRFFDESKFIFRGTVQATGRANVKLVSNHPNTALVTVDEVYSGGDAMLGLAGRAVTVVHEPGADYERGKTYLFFTNAIVFSDTVGVRAVGHTDFADDTKAMVTDYLKQAAARPLEKRVLSADLIIIGRVTGLRAVSPVVISEHDPDWWIATVAVVSSLYGDAGKEVEVVFANSKDIAWYKAPKLASGDSAVLLLHELTDQKEIPHPDRKLYQIIDPLDRLPLSRVDEIQPALQKKGKG